MDEVFNIFQNLSRKLLNGHHVVFLLEFENLVKEKYVLHLETIFFLVSLMNERNLKILNGWVDLV